MSRNLLARINLANSGRDPQRLAMKYAAMRASAFRFFRGSCHLFFEDWPRRSPLDKAPAGWITGDLHLENFGSYKGDDRQIYFDLNDFDEAVLAPCTWELARTLTSIHLATSERGEPRKLARARAAHFAETWTASLRAGKAGTIVQATAQGPVRQLIDAVAQRKRADFLDRRTRVSGQQRRIIIDGKHALVASAAQQARVSKAIQRHARQHNNPDWFEVLDIAQRIAGTGSLGVDRYVILIRGKGGPDGNYLLDLKEARPSALQPRLRVPQPIWHNEAERIVTIQNRMQAVSPARLSALRMGSRCYVLKELQPREDRLDMSQLKAAEEFEQALSNMAQVSAWSLLRSGGREGSAYADQWIRFASKHKWLKSVLQYADHYSERVDKDWQTFVKASPHI